MTICSSTCSTSSSSKAVTSATRGPPMIERDATRDAPVMLPSCWGRSARDAPICIGALRGTLGRHAHPCGLVAVMSADEPARAVFELRLVGMLKWRLRRKPPQSTSNRSVATSRFLAVVVVSYQAARYHFTNQFGPDDFRGKRLVLHERDCRLCFGGATEATNSRDQEGRGKLAAAPRRRLG